MDPEDEFIKQLAHRQSRSRLRPIAWGIAILICLAAWAAFIWWLLS